MIDLLDGPSLTPCHHGGPFTADEPFPVRLDLDQLG